MTFEIDIGEDGDTAQEQSGVRLRSGAIVFTRLTRPDSAEPDDYLNAPPIQLAFWFIDNWWRLRWEGIPPAGMTEDWRLAHELSSIGGGYVWPRLSIWGEDQRVGLASRSDPPGVVGPVRYLTDALCFVASNEFEKTVDAFLQRVAESGPGINTDRDAFQAQLRALSAERSDGEIADWRRMEARLGYDVDEAPDVLIDALGELGRSYGEKSVEEAAMAAPGPDALTILQGEIEAAESSRLECDFTDAVRATRGHVVDRRSSPWVLAERVAAGLRDTAGIARGPLRNTALGELVATRADSFKARSYNAEILPYGLKLPMKRGSRDKIAARSRWSHDRRFEIARACGDAVWTNGPFLGPLGDAGTARQKFQRAFAQSLLCPFDDLMDFLERAALTDDDLFAAAKHFHVSDKTIRTVLVNKGKIGRERLTRPAYRRSQLDGLEEQADAA